MFFTVALILFYRFAVLYIWICENRCKKMLGMQLVFVRIILLSLLLYYSLQPLEADAHQCQCSTIQSMFPTCFFSLYEKKKNFRRMERLSWQNLFPPVLNHEDRKWNHSDHTWWTFSFLVCFQCVILMIQNTKIRKDGDIKKAVSSYQLVNQLAILYQFWPEWDAYELIGVVDKDWDDSWVFISILAEIKLVFVTLWAHRWTVEKWIRHRSSLKSLLRWGFFSFFFHSETCH